MSQHLRERSHALHLFTSTLTSVFSSSVLLSSSLFEVIIFLILLSCSLPPEADTLYLFFPRNLSRFFSLRVAGGHEPMDLMSTICRKKHPKVTSNEESPQVARLGHGDAAVMAAL